MRLMTAALALTLGLTPLAARADDATRLKLAHDLMEQIHASDTMRQLLPILAAQMRQQIAQQGQLDKDADAFVSGFKERASAEMGRYTDLMAEAYAREFTEDELNGLLAFDRTPLGQKLIAKTPELAQASMLAGRQLGIEVAKEVIDDMQAKKKETSQPKL